MAKYKVSCKSRYSRKSRTGGYARFVKQEFKYHFKKGTGAAGARAAMKAVAKAWVAKCGKKSRTSR